MPKPKRRDPAALACLIVEQSPTIRKMGAAMLGELGYDAIEAADAEAALKALESETPAFAILDWELPGGGAMNVFQAIAALPEAERPPVILCATENDLHEFAVAKAAGASTLLLKPFDVGSIAAAVDEVGAASPSQREAKAG